MQTKTSRNEKENHIERKRSNYNTTDLGSIMARFYAAVSWREN